MEPVPSLTTRWASVLHGLGRAESLEKLDPATRTQELEKDLAARRTVDALAQHTRAWG